MSRLIIFLVSFFIMSNVHAFGFRFFNWNPWLHLQNKVTYGSAAWPVGTSFSIPGGKKAIQLIVYGGGGSGASCWYAGTGASGGGAGNYNKKNLQISNTVIPAPTIGAGGSSVTSAYAGNGQGSPSTKGGNAGGTTSLTIDGIVYTASGGNGGSCSSSVTVPAIWSAEFPGNSFINGASVSSFSGATGYTQTNYSGGQAGLNGNGGSALWVTNYTFGTGVTNGSMNAADYSGAGGGAAWSPLTSGGANGVNSGAGGSGGVILYY